jgi:hypothetical protein
MSPWEDKTMTDLLAPRARAAIAAIFLCCVAPSIATAADRGLGNDAAAACAALSGTGTGTTKIDAAALTEPQPLAVAASGPAPAARISPATPSFCRVLGHIDPTDPKAPPIRFELNLPLTWNGRSVQYGGGGFNGVLITGVGLPPAAPFDGASPLAKGFATYGTDSVMQPSRANRLSCLLPMTRPSSTLPVRLTRKCATPPSC